MNAKTSAPRSRIAPPAEGCLRYPGNALLCTQSRALHGQHIVDELNTDNFFDDLHQIVVAPWLMFPDLGQSNVG